MPTKQAKPIALICNSKDSGMTYILNTYKNHEIDTIIPNRLIRLKSGIEIIMITSLGEADGREFSQYIIHPNYEDELVASVRARVR